MAKNNNYILEHIKERSNNTGIFYLNHDIPVWTEDPLSDSVDLKKVLYKISRLIPSAYLHYVQAVRIGTFDEMVEREVNALYKDGVLYISNMQDNNSDMIDDMVHEIAHAVEEHNRDLIYEDKTILLEFLGKRKRLHSLLKSEGYNAKIEQFLTVKYSYDFDMFLFQEIGYPVLNTLSMGLFPSPYSITSINEYFAIGFEKFYIGEANYLKRICPELSIKINYLDEMTNEYQ
tara:strand:- start:590 stop:1285 length:696 start_codon:yes stop_codon:yes gene_type:complete